MSSSQSNDDKRALYLEHIEIETTIKKDFRVGLQIDGRDVEIQRERQTSIWTPFRSLELPDASKITLFIRTGRLTLRKREVQVEFSGQEAMEAFWTSTDSISRAITFNQQSAIVTFRFRPSPNSETTRAVVQQLESTMETYRVIMSGSTEQAIDLVFKHGAVLAEINPVVSAAFSIAKGVFEVLKEQKKSDGLVSDLADEIARITPFAKLVLEEIICDETELLHRAVTKMCSLIMDTATFICVYAKQSPSVRAMRSAISTDARSKIETFQKELITLKEDFDRAIDVTALKIGRDNRKKLVALARDQDAAEELRLLDRLKPLDAPSFEEDRSCMDGTRTTILSDIISWSETSSDEVPGTNDSNNDSVFWLYGIPGVGKTYVANSLSRLLRKKGSLGEEVSFADETIRLASMWTPYRKLVAQALRDQPDFNPDSTDSEALFNRLKSLEEHPPRALVLVVDAFDECGEPRTRERLLSTLMDACHSIHWLKLVITSRREYDIVPFFNKLGVAGWDLAAENEARDDIRRFTKSRMALIGRECHLPGDWPGEERLEQIVERSGDLFIFVNTVCLLVDGFDPEAALALVLSGKLEDVNTELHKLYSKILVSRVERSQEKFRSFARAFIVVATHRPLSDVTLASLTGMELPIIQSLVDRLSSLLYQDGSKNGGIRVRHLSVIEFLTGPTCPSEFRVDLQQGNEELSTCCLTTMMKELKFNICDLETSLLANAEIHGLDRRVAEKIPDELQYSCMHWSSYLCSHSDPTSTVDSALLDGIFAGPRPLYWIEVLSLVGKVPVAIAALRQIKSCAKKFQSKDRELVNDILRFLVAFFTPVSTSTPHLYISGLAFMPAKTRLWKNVSESFPRAIDVCKGRMQSWPTLPRVWLGHTGEINSVAYSPDGRHVVSGSEDNTIRIWDAETGETVVEPLRGHNGPVCSVTYSPDGRHVASSSDDKTIRIWNADVEGDGCGSVLDPSPLPAGSSDARRLVSTHRPSLAALSGAIPPDMLGHNGYVYSAEGLLFWVPEDCRHGITCPAIMAMPNSGRQRCVRVDLSDFQYGTSWTKIYRPQKGTGHDNSSSSH